MYVTKLFYSERNSVKIPALFTIKQSKRLNGYHLLGDNLGKIVKDTRILKICQVIFILQHTNISVLSLYLQHKFLLFFL